MEQSVGTLDINSLLGELETGSSGSCANVIRKLREHEVAAYEAGCGGPKGKLVADFVACLDRLVTNRDLEIEKTCGHHYKGFAEATQEIFTIQEETTTLQGEIQGIRSEIDTSVTKLNEVFGALSTTRNSLEKIDQCIGALKISIPVFDQFIRIEKSISEGRYYHALTALEHLEHTQLKMVQPYAFAQILSNRIPKLRADIKAASLAQLTDFLEEIRKHSVRLGAVAMQRTAESTGMDADPLSGNINDLSKLGQSTQQDTTTRKHHSRTTSDVTLQDNEISPNSNVAKSFQLWHRSLMGPRSLEAELEELAASAVALEGGLDAKDAADWRQARINVEDVVNFGPVYRCLHIHTILGERAEFERYYCTQRRKQCQLTLSLSPFQQASLRNYGEFFSTIVGFFLVDDYLRHTLSGSSGVYQVYLDELWTGVVPKLLQLSQSNCQACLTTKELLRLKHFSVLFDRTMVNLNFNTAGLSDMIEVIRKRYELLLAIQWREKFETILADDNYTAITVANEGELAKLLKLYPTCNTPEMAVLPFPRMFAFSEMVPKLYASLRAYIQNCRQFSEHMDLSWTELEDILGRAANVLFTDYLNVVLTSAIKASEGNLLRLIQLTVNLNELETVCSHLEVFLQQALQPTLHKAATSASDKQPITPSFDEVSQIDPSLVTPTTDNLHSRSLVCRLHGVSVFKDTRALAESQIYANLNGRVDEFFELARYDGIVGGSGQGDPVTEQPAIDFSDGSVVNIKPTEYIKDMTDWLSSTFAAFTHLPPKVAQTACISACKHIAQLLQVILIGPEVRIVTETALLQVAADLNQCDNFARSDPVPGVDKSILPLVFQELRQLLELVMKGDWNTYTKNYGKASANPYDRVPPSVGLKLLDRLREGEKKQSKFITLKKEDRERRRKYDDAIRKLKDLQHAAGGR